VLGELTEMIGSNGILIFSSHNLDAPRPDSPRLLDGLRGPWSLDRTEAALGALARRAAATSPGGALRAVTESAGAWRRRRVLSRMTYRSEGHAVLNGPEHGYRLLHYYVGRDEQERQLRELGYALSECLDRDGHPVAPGERSTSEELHYVAYPR
jgi:hypothetical protein